MIKRFSTLYVGHIELEQCGLSGTPADDRRYPNERLTEVFDTAVALARATDALGYETLWLAEHHFQHEGYECIPNIPMLAVDLAHRTERVKIGCAFNIVPTWHPLRLAEDYATADILTRGRVVFGVGRGYHTPRGGDASATPCWTPRPTASCSRSRWRSSSRRSARSPSRTRASTTRFRPRSPTAATRLKEITLVPRPVHQPVEVWQPIVSGSAREPRLHGQARHQGRDLGHRRGARRALAPRLPGGGAPARAGARSSART